MRNLDQISLADLISGSLADAKQIQAAIAGIDPELRLVGGAAGEALIISRIDELPEGIIDLLAWQYHCDFYSDTLTLEQKRNLVRDSILWHRKKGTKWAVLKVLENLGLKAELTEWFEFGGHPYTFNVAITFPNDPNKTFNFMDSEIEQIIRDAINEAKPVHADIFSLVAKDEARDPDHICYWDVCNWEHGRSMPLGAGQDCEVEIPHDGEVIHVGIENQYGDVAGITRFLSWDVSHWDDMQPDTGAVLSFDQNFSLECERVLDEEVSVTFRSYPYTMAAWDFTPHDGLPVMEPTLLTGGWSGVWDGSRFNEKYLKRERRLVTSFVSESPVVEIDLRELGLDPNASIAEIVRDFGVNIDAGNRENEISVTPLWEVYDTWRTRGVWDARSWRSNQAAPDVVESNFESEVLAVTTEFAPCIEVARVEVNTFGNTIFDGAPPERELSDVSVTQEF